MEFMKLMEDWDGYVNMGKVGDNDPGYEHKLKETIDLLSNIKGMPRHRQEYLIREAITTSDFPYLFGDVLDRQVLATYKAVDPVWKPFARMSTVPDFRNVRRFSITGGDQVLDEVAEKGEYLTSPRDENYYAYAIAKYGRQFDISWESLINDELNALKDTPERFARAATRTEHRVADKLWVHNVLGAGAAAHTFGGTLYSTFAGEINLTAGALTINFLEQGLEAMAGFTDIYGEAIQNRAKFLVVPPALEMTARQILTSANKLFTGGAGGTAWPTTNVLPQYGLTLIVDPYIPIIDTALNAGVARATRNTGWYLFADPRDIAAFEVSHLRGHERPEVCMKASDKVTVGGGAINAMSGDFATDNVFYRVRLCFGGRSLDWRATYMGGHTD